MELIAVTLRAKLLRMRESSIVRSVSMLLSGTLVAQAISVLTLPIITRLYTPKDFSLFAVYVAVAGIVSIAACLRLEVAIPMPEHDKDAVNLLALAMTSAFVVSICAGLVVFCFPAAIAKILRRPSLEPYLWLLPFSVFLASSYSALQYWATRKKRFAQIARTRIAQSVGGSSMQLVWGWGVSSPLGLLLGQFITSGAGITSFIKLILKYDRSTLKSVTVKNMRRMWIEYHRFPKYSALESIANSAGLQLSLMLISALVTGAEVGYVFLATRIMQIPINLIGTSLSQVFIARASSEFRNGSLGTLNTKIVFGLIKLGAGPLIFAGLVAPNLIPIIFGPAWHRAGVLVSWMTPWFVTSLMAAPISMSLHVVSRQRLALVLQLFGLGIRTLPIILTYKLGIASETFAISSFAFYATYLLTVFRVTPPDLRIFKRELIPSMSVVALWCAAGVIARVAMSFFW